MAPTLGCVIRSTPNPDSSYTLQIVSPDQTTHTVWSDTDIAIGHYFCGTPNKHGRHSALPIPAEEEQHIALAHRSFSNACQQLLTLRKQLQQLRTDCERQIQVCRKRKEGAGCQILGNAVGGAGVTVAGILTGNPLMIGGGLLALSRIGSADAEASAQVAEEHRLKDLLARKEQELAGAQRAVHTTALAYAAAFHLPTQRLKLLRSYNAR